MSGSISIVPSDMDAESCCHCSCSLVDVSAHNYHVWAYRKNGELLQQILLNRYDDFDPRIKQLGWWHDGYTPGSEVGKEFIASNTNDYYARYIGGTFKWTADDGDYEYRPLQQCLGSKTASAGYEIPGNNYKDGVIWGNNSLVPTNEITQAESMVVDEGSTYRHEVWVRNLYGDYPWRIIYRGPSIPSQYYDIYPAGYTYRMTPDLSNPFHLAGTLTEYPAYIDNCFATIEGGYNFYHNGFTRLNGYYWNQSTQQIIGQARPLYYRPVMRPDRKYLTFPMRYDFSQYFVYDSRRETSHPGVENVAAWSNDGFIIDTTKYQDGVQAYYDSYYEYWTDPYFYVSPLSITGGHEVYQFWHIREPGDPYGEECYAQYTSAFWLQYPCVADRYGACKLVLSPQQKNVGDTLVRPTLL